MPIRNQIERLQQAKEDFKEKLIEKGVEVGDDLLISDYPPLLDEIKTGVDTTDATATSDDIRFGKTAYVNEQKVVGNIEDYEGEVEGTGESSYDVEERFLTRGFANFENTNVKYIDSCVFYNNNKLKEVKLPKCEIIGESAFQYCYNLSSAYIPNCKVLKSYAFQSCSLKSLTTEELVYIGYSALAGVKIENTCFPNCIYLEDYALDGLMEELDLPLCYRMASYATVRTSRNLKTVNIPKCIYIGGNALPSTSIEVYAPECLYLSFNWMSKVNIYAPNLINCYANFGSCLSEEIEAEICCKFSTNAFVNAEIIRANYPMCVTFESSMFRGCQNLSEVYIGRKAYIYSNAFGSCVNLSNVYVCDTSVKLNVTNAFANTPISDSSYLGYYGSIYVPSSRVDYYKSATNWATYADRITALPSEIENGYIFTSEYVGFSSKDIPIEKQDAKYVFDDAFSYCSFIENVSLSSCIAIGTSAFYSCSNLKILDLPKCKYIGASAFYKCSKIAELSLPECVYIGTSAFQSCSSLSKLYLPNCLTIGAYAFNSAHSLKNFPLDLPKCKEIGYSAFYGIDFPELSLPECVQISPYAFFYNSSLKSLYLPNVVQVQGFEGCENLKTVNLPKCVKIGSDAFITCTRLEEINVPICTSIGSRAFYNCSSLSRIELNNVSFISNSAFQNCINLMSVYLKNTFTSIISSDVFFNSPMQYSSYTGTFGSVYVNKNLIDVYINDPVWSYYADRIVAYEGEV